MSVNVTILVDLLGGLGCPKLGEITLTGNVSINSGDATMLAFKTHPTEMVLGQSSKGHYQANASGCLLSTNSNPSTGVLLGGTIGGSLGCMLCLVLIGATVALRIRDRKTRKIVLESTVALLDAEVKLRDVHTYWEETQAQLEEALCPVHAFSGRLDITKEQLHACPLGMTVDHLATGQTPWSYLKDAHGADLLPAQLMFAIGNIKDDSYQ
eukprot:gene4392-4652_t